MSQKFDGAENASPNQSDNLYQKQQLILKPKSWLTGLLWRPNVKRMTREKNVDGLLQALTHPKPKVRWTVMRALGQLWDLSDLVNLGHLDPDIRAQAAEALGLLNDKRAVNPLIASLWDPTVIYFAEIRYFFPVRMEAIKALGKIGDPVAIAPLLEALRKRSWGYSAEGNEPLYASLVNFGKPMLAYLITLLQDDERDMRKLAIHALGYFNDSQAIEPLSQALRDKQDRLLKRAAIARIEDEQIKSVLNLVLKHEKDPLVRSDIRKFLAVWQKNRPH